MIIEHQEKVTSHFRGTVIDIEAIGEFDKCYKRTNDSREYQYMQQVIFGLIGKHQLCIYCAEGLEAISALVTRTEHIINSLDRPFHAFNSDFERGVWFHQLNRIIDFDGELNRRRYESKRRAVTDLDIPNYDDPFYDDGYQCMMAWQNGEFAKAIAHNRACLLKERDILIKRGSRRPDELVYATE